MGTGGIPAIRFALVGTTLWLHPRATSSRHFLASFYFILTGRLGCQGEVLGFCANERPPLSLTQRKYVARLEDLRDTLENSPFFKTHEVRVLGTSRCMWAPV